jgi:hypothetical protein
MSVCLIPANLHSPFIILSLSYFFIPHSVIQKSTKARFYLLLKHEFTLVFDSAKLRKNHFKGFTFLSDTIIGF